MDRKIKKKPVDLHYDKPEHQRWLYQMADWGLGKAMLVVWLVCIGIIVLTLVLLKSVFGAFK